MTFVLPVYSLLICLLNSFYHEYAYPVSFALLIRSMIAGNVISVNMRHYSLLEMTLPNDVTAFPFHIKHLSLLAKQDLRILGTLFQTFSYLFIDNQSPVVINSSSSSKKKSNTNSHMFMTPV